MDRVVIMILQGSAVSQTVLGGLIIIYPPVAYLLESRVGLYVAKTMRVGWQ